MPVPKGYFGPGNEDMENIDPAADLAAAKATLANSSLGKQFDAINAKRDAEIANINSPSVDPNSTVGRLLALAKEHPYLTTAAAALPLAAMAAPAAVGVFGAGLPAAAATGALTGITTGALERGLQDDPSRAAGPQGWGNALETMGENAATGAATSAIPEALIGAGAVRSAVSPLRAVTKNILGHEITPPTALAAKATGSALQRLRNAALGKMVSSETPGDIPAPGVASTPYTARFTDPVEEAAAKVRAGFWNSPEAEQKLGRAQARGTVGQTPAAPSNVNLNPPPPTSGQPHGAGSGEGPGGAPEGMFSEPGGTGSASIDAVNRISRTTRTDFTPSQEHMVTDASPGTQPSGGDAYDPAQYRTLMNDANTPNPSNRPSVTQPAPQPGSGSARNEEIASVNGIRRGVNRDSDIGSRFANRLNPYDWQDVPLPETQTGPMENAYLDTLRDAIGGSSAMGSEHPQSISFGNQYEPSFEASQVRQPSTSAEVGQPTANRAPTPKTLTPSQQGFLKKMKPIVDAYRAAKRAGAANPAYDYRIDYSGQ